MKVTNISTFKIASLDAWRKLPLHLRKAKVSRAGRGDKSDRNIDGVLNVVSSTFLCHH